MRNILKLILKYHFIIIFILLEIICFSLIIAHNSYQRSFFFKHTSSVSASISGNVNAVKEYFNLKELNKQLVRENLLLKNTLEYEYTKLVNLPEDSLKRDSEELTENDYVYRTAKTVNTTFNKTKNYLTINKGYASGIREDMAVCSAEGVIGVVQNVSRKHAVVLPLINTNLRVSAKIKKNSYYGSLQWDGNDYRYSYLRDIPFHVNVEQGDTIVTSGFSSIFPEGETIGFVESVDKATANFIIIKVKLATDFKKVSNVYIIENINKEELIKLEQESYDSNQ